MAEKICVFRLPDFYELEKTGSNGPSVKMNIFPTFLPNLSSK